MVWAGSTATSSSGRPNDALAYHAHVVSELDAVVDRRVLLVHDHHRPVTCWECVAIGMGTLVFIVVITLFQIWWTRRQND